MHPASHRPINRYYESLHAIQQQGAITEGATRIAFQNLLAEGGKGRGFTILGEQTIQLPTRPTIRKWSLSMSRHQGVLHLTV